MRRIRELNYLWRTEQIYRAWGWRFAKSLGGRAPEVATADDVRAFLSQLAAEDRVSVSTQRQALNAVAFLLREALGREVGNFGDFLRARPRRSVPVVLSRSECQRLFGALDGTFRLMAELAYGAGLRLNELLHLRVKDLDFDRRQLIVFAGKGAKDRPNVLPESLVPRLQLPVEKTVRAVFDEDRSANRPGVWLPESLARKYPRAGEQWQWFWVFPSRNPLRDHRTGEMRRHHVSDATFQVVIKQAATRAVSRSGSRRACCGIPLPRTCWRQASIFAPFRTCSGTAASKPCRSTRTSCRSSGSGCAARSICSGQARWMDRRWA